ncbi:hypothetical protein [Streptomyces sp. NBC_00083]|uniref:hypothetical protein n=1 Tax=Streptomyces sp. NBC_00083 TaxID=2975647 RepID=UPI00224F0DEF|nr:hypothetical protein [Streptomyces sp. NBC_00083]MCX5384824.1 hypothetical protein [Streptomyces sp. NBC_00083]
MVDIRRAAQLSKHGMQCGAQDTVTCPKFRELAAWWCVPTPGEGHRNLAERAPDRQRGRPKRPYGTGYPVKRR